MLLILSAFILTSIAYTPVFSENIKGVVRIGDATFDKIVQKHKYVLVKFDEQYPPNEKESAWKKLAAAATDQKDLLLADMQLSEYGDEDSINGKIAKRYHVSKTNYPVYKLFIQGKANPVDLTGAKEFNDLKRFIVRETSLWLDLPGCLKSFNKYAKDFMKTSEKNAQNKILEKADASVQTLSKKNKKMALRYIDIMKNILVNGEDYLASEIKNLSRSVNDSTPKNRLQMKKKLDILYYFRHLNS